MDLTETTTLSLQELPGRLMQEASISGSVLLSGPSGSGKTHTLHQLAADMQAAGIDHVLISHTDDDALERIRSAPPSQIHLFDGLEFAEYEVMEAILDRISRGATGFQTVRNDVLSQGYGSALQRLFAETPDANQTLATTRSFQIAPLGYDEAVTFIHEHRFVSLDSVTLSAIIELSWGRPGWLLDLLQLASAQKISVDPLPGITALDLGELHLPALRHASNAAPRLTAEEIAAAITLSIIEPRSINGARALVGTSAAGALRDARILIETPHNPQLLWVPELYAAPLRLRADATTLDRTKHLTAERLLTQEALGLPLPDRDARFCAWWLGPSANVESTPDSGPQAHLSHAHSQLLTKVSSDLIAFGKPESRDLLLKSSGTHTLGTLPRVRAVTVVRGPLEGLRSLGAPDPMSSTQHDVAPALNQFGIEFLRCQLLAEVEAPGVTVFDQSQMPDDELQRATLVFSRWNDVEPIGSDAAALLEIAQTHTVAEVALLAEQLLALTHAQHGYEMPPLGTIAPGEASQRCDRLANMVLHTNDELRDLRTTASVVEGLICFLSAGNVADLEPLQRAVERSPSASYQQLWLQHLSATSISVAAGATRYAATEWAHFEHRLPRFIPVRLRVLVAGVLAELQRPGSTAEEQRDASFALLNYFRGDTSAQELTSALADNPLTTVTQASPLPVFRTVLAHLEAAEAQNPAALMRAADELASRKFWAPATLALQGARVIYLRRRASGSVSRCDTKLAALESLARHDAPWFSISAFHSAPRAALSKRELDTAKLASEGLSNRQIAEQLQCAQRTVESHLASARAKLGASRRTELTVRMREFGYA